MKRAITARHLAGRRLGHFSNQARLCLSFLTAFCPFLLGPRAHQLRNTLDHTDLAILQKADDTAAPFNQGDLLRFWNQELRYSNLGLPSCYYWESWKRASQEQRICSEENVKKWRLVGPQPQQREVLLLLQNSG